MKDCPVCKTPFHPKNKQSVYCSHACRNKAAMQAKSARKVQRVIVCQCCGTQFKPNGSKAKYCSPACLSKVEQEQYQARYRASKAVKNCIADLPNASDYYQVTNPYGSHAFDGWVAKCLTGGAHA